MESAIAGASAFVEGMRDGDKAMVITFNGAVHEVHGFTERKKDLRLLGFFNFVSYKFLQRALLLAWTGLGINFLSGTVLFVPRGVEYTGDPAFLTKMVLIVFGLGNTGWLHGQIVSESGTWSSEVAAPVSVRYWAGASMRWCWAILWRKPRPWVR